MLVIEHPMTNARHGAPENWDVNRDGPIETLPTITQGGIHHSFWQPEPHELEMLAGGGSVQLSIASSHHPVVAMRVDPFPSAKLEVPNALRVPDGWFIVALGQVGVDGGWNCTIQHKSDRLLTTAHADIFSDAIALAVNEGAKKLTAVLHGLRERFNFYQEACRKKGVPYPKMSSSLVDDPEVLEKGIQQMDSASSGRFDA